MGLAATVDMIEMAGGETALRWHLSSNHYPPVPASMVPVCAEAVLMASSGEWDAMISLPDSVSYRGMDVAPVWAIVEAHHLQPFVTDGEEF